VSRFRIFFFFPFFPCFSFCSVGRLYGLFSFFVQLKARFARREEAKDEEAEAKEVGTVADVDRFSRRQVKVTKEHNEECRRLLKLMGIPVIVVCLLPLFMFTSINK
jgi:hypothetical protein